MLAELFHIYEQNSYYCKRFGTLIVATIYLQLIQNRYMFRSFTVLQCSHQHIAGNGLYTMLVTTLKGSKTSKHVSILFQL